MQTQKMEQENLEQAEDKLFNFRPFLFFAVFFLLGIIFACLRQTQKVTNSVLWLFVFFIFPLIFSRSWKRFRTVCLGICALIFAFSLGCNSFLTQTREFTDCGYYQDVCVVSGRVVELTRREDGICLTLDKITVDGENEKSKLVAYLPASFEDSVHISDEVLLTGKVVTNTRIFISGELRAYAIEKDAPYTLYADDGVVTGESANLFLRIRERIRQTVYKGMDETPASVTMALLTGDTDGIGEGLLENIRYGGIAHIFAVSGLHIGALYAFCIWLMQKGKLYKIHAVFRFLIIATVLLFYGGVCGYSSSVVRAIVTCLALYATKLIGLGDDISERIGLACILVLLISPVSAYTVGFQLSFSACLGIAWLARPIRRVCFVLIGENKRVKDDKPLTIWQSCYRGAITFFAVTLSAQLATASILYRAFGYLSVWGLLLNCIFVPLISLVFSFLLLAVFLACLCSGLAVVILYIPNLLLTTALLLFETADFSAFVLTGFTVTEVSVVTYYLALLFATDKFNIKAWQSRIVSGCYFALWLTALIVANL